MAPAAGGPGRLRELALLFLRLGATSFGGPAAHVAMIEHEVVRRRGWLGRAELLDLLGAVNLIPGPNSTELAIHVGWRRAGWAGLLVAGLSFILPAAVLVLLLAAAYVRFGTLPVAGAILRGVKPVIVAVVLQALWGFGRTAVKGPLLAAVLVAAFAASLAGANELVLLGACGAAVAVSRAVRRDAPAAALALPTLPALPAVLAAAPAVGLWPIFLFFLKVGSVLFGSGYVLLAFLRADLVERWHWLTDAQLLDAIAVGQVTPGPVFTTATFVGYLLAGTPGAIVATVGIFAPAFAFVAASGPLLPRLRASRVAGAFLDGVNVASLALMAAVSLHLGRSAIDGPWTAAIAAVALAVLWKYRVNSAWLVLAGGVLGWVAGAWAAPR